MRSSSNYLLYTYFPWARGLLCLIDPPSLSLRVAGWLAGWLSSERILQEQIPRAIGCLLPLPGGLRQSPVRKGGFRIRHPRPPPPVSVSTQGRCQPSMRGPWHPLTLTDPRPSPGRCSSSFSSPLPAGHCLPAAGPVPLHSPPVSLGARQAFPSPKPFPAETPYHLEVPRALAGWTKFTRQNRPLAPQSYCYGLNVRPPTPSTPAKK